MEVISKIAFTKCVSIINFFHKNAKNGHDRNFKISKFLRGMPFYTLRGLNFSDGCTFHRKEARA